MTRRSFLAAATVLIGAAVGLLAAAVTAQPYRAEVDLFVSSADESTAVAVTCSGGCTGRDLYAGIIAAGRSPRVIHAVLAELHLDLTDAQLADAIDVQADTTQVHVAVTDADRAQADRLATALATRLTEIAPTIELTGPFRNLPVQLNVIRPATSESRGRPWWRDALVGALAGALVAALVQLVLHRRRRRTSDG